MVRNDNKVAIESQLLCISCSVLDYTSSSERSERIEDVYRKISRKPWYGLCLDNENWI